MGSICKNGERQKFDEVPGELWKGLRQGFFVRGILEDQFLMEYRAAGSARRQEMEQQVLSECSGAYSELSEDLALLAEVIRDLKRPFLQEKNRQKALEYFYRPGGPAAKRRKFTLLTAYRRVLKRKERRLLNVELGRLEHAARKVPGCSSCNS